MAGIYIHVPFCKQRCTYCDFYTEVAPNSIQAFVDALIIEIEQRKSYLKNAIIETIYFGGGTPSALSIEQLHTIFVALKNEFEIHTKAEITIEANPDDLSDIYFEGLQTLPFNRLSMGIQSFKDEELRFVNRRHNASQAIAAVSRAKKYGFTNISIDLIYGLPQQSFEQWQLNVQQAIALEVKHISAYGLTYEAGTKLWRQRAKSLVVEADDELMIQMSDYLRDTLRNAGYEAYEISNFALPGFRSRHNSSYWNMIPYLGLGPSAHSYDGNSRQWNVASIKKYINAIANETAYYEKEILTERDNYNDYVMVALRTSEGIDLSKLLTLFGEAYQKHCVEKAENFIKNNDVLFYENFIKLTDKGFNISNRVIMDLMMD
jgi:oxygen-independent coproporphyrinogen III oxidase